MGNFFSSFNILNFFYQKKANGLMLGLDGAGKTTILYNLKLNEFIHTIPTIGFNVETVKYNNLNLTIWDLGGQEKIRKLWRHYFDNVDMLIYVVDSCDISRIEETKNELHYLDNHDQLSNMKSILIYCNKMDLPDSLGCAEMAEKLDLNRLLHKWYIQPSCATKNQGIYEGLDWLSNNLD
jgi:ADP-ribosylation factor protein 1